jgi:hypothetical protein
VARRDGMEVVTMSNICKPSMFLTAVALAASVAIAYAETFRLEVGPPVAAGPQYKTKGALFAARPRGCTDLSAVQMSGTAEGIVGGRRQSIPLKLVDLDDGVRVVTYHWTTEGTWIVVLNGVCSSPRETTAAIVRVPGFGMFTRDGMQILDHPATPKEIDAALTAFAKAQARSPQR